MAAYNSRITRATGFVRETPKPWWHNPHPGTWDDMPAAPSTSWSDYEKEDPPLQDRYDDYEEDTDDCRSVKSYYSLPGLSKNGRNRHFRILPAREVRKQRRRIPVTAKPGDKYPHTYDNWESLPLTVASSWQEYPIDPIFRDTRGFFTPHYRTSPGPARIIFNPHQPHMLDVIYHAENEDGEFLMANYHRGGFEARAIAEGLGPKPLRAPSEPTSSSSASSTSECTSCTFDTFGTVGSELTKSDTSEFVEDEPLIVIEDEPLISLYVPTAEDIKEYKKLEVIEALEQKERLEDRICIIMGWDKDE